MWDTVSKQKPHTAIVIIAKMQLYNLSIFTEFLNWKSSCRPSGSILSSYKKGKLKFKQKKSQTVISGHIWDFWYRNSIFFGICTHTTASQGSKEAMRTKIKDCCLYHSVCISFQNDLCPTNHGTMILCCVCASKSFVSKRKGLGRSQDCQQENVEEKKSLKLDEIVQPKEIAAGIIATAKTRLKP